MKNHIGYAPTFQDSIKKRFTQLLLKTDRELPEEQKIRFLAKMRMDLKSFAFNNKNDPELV